MRRRFVLAPLLLLALAACHSGSSDSGAATPAAAPPRPIPPAMPAQSLDDASRRALGDLLASEPSPCKQGQSLYDAYVAGDCRRAKIGGDYILALLEKGRTRDEAQKAYESREVTPPAKVTVDGAPMEGDPSGTVWIAEFADFQCPHCAHLFPELQKVIADEPGKVRIYFKYFPLPMHPYGRLAAQAAEAAKRQGKFWEMARLLFANGENLDPALIDKLAEQAGLDMARFKQDEASAEVQAAVAQSSDEGRRLGIEGTPTLFVNGRMLESPTSADEIENWVDELQ